MNTSLFLFDGELTVDNANMQAVTGCLCATPSLLVRLKQQESKSLPSGASIAAGVIDNPNFYAQYYPATGTVGILSAYWTQQMEQGRVIEKFISMDLSLSREEELAVVSAMEAHCQKEYGQTCIDFLNELRRDCGLIALPGLSNRPSVDNLIQAAKGLAAKQNMDISPRMLHSHTQ